MIDHGPIVCGGGWKERKERPIRFKAWCCLALFFLSFILPYTFREQLDVPLLKMVFLVIPAVLLLLTIILFRFERPQTWWGPPDMKGSDRIFRAQKPAVPNVPPYDPHKLY